MKTKLTLTMLAVSLMASNLLAASPDSGTLRVVVLNAAGQPTEAPVYIYGDHKGRFLGAQDVNGATTFNMPEGIYKVSAAVTQKNGDYLDRYASNEAMIQIIPGDNTSVILSLKQIEDPTPALTYSSLRRMGLPSDVNNF